MEIYTTTELAKMLKVSPGTVRSEIKRGQLNCFYVGVEARFTQHHINEYTNIKEFNKTTREFKLEAEIKELRRLLEDKNQTIKDIRDIIFRDSS